MITLKAIIIDVLVLGLVAWGVIQFLHYKERGKEAEKSNGWK